MVLWNCRRVLVKYSCEIFSSVLKFFFIPSTLVFVRKFDSGEVKQNGEWAVVTQSQPWDKKWLWITQNVYSTSDFVQFARILFSRNLLRFKRPDWRLGGNSRFLVRVRPGFAYRDVVKAYLSFWCQGGRIETPFNSHYFPVLHDDGSWRNAIWKQYSLAFYDQEFFGVCHVWIMADSSQMKWKFPTCHDEKSRQNKLKV